MAEWKVPKRNGQWLVARNATPPPRSPKGPEAISDRALKKIYASSRRFTANVNRAEIREMIRRGFFVKGAWLDELEKLESVAKEIVNERDKKGKTLLETEPEFWGRAKQIVDLATKMLPKERYPGLPTATGQVTVADQACRSQPLIASKEERVWPN